MRFATNPVSEAYLHTVELPTGGEQLLLPGLPAIPPGGSLKLYVFENGFGDPDVELAIDGVSKTVKMIKHVPGNWLVSVYEDPALVLLLGGPALWLLAVIIGASWKAFVAYMARAEPGQVLFYTAEGAAVAGKSTEALELLKRAVALGFKDKGAIRKSNRLRTISDEDDFKKLIQD